MKKLLVGTALCALLSGPALADEAAKATTEPVRLSLTQMDGLTAGSCFGSVCIARNRTTQVAAAVAIGGGSFGSVFSSNAAANAQNVNVTDQN